MSVYIPGLEMPVDGWHKVIKIFSDGTVVSYYDSVELAKAIPVPEHGDLIDRDALPWEKQSLMVADEDWALPCVLIEDAPTIIPADHIGDANEMVADKEGEG